uniref:Uncharacterized protein n=1 Tax=Arundo donax TaxID=35708 RepID=A0A0A8YB42_ARUDO
MRKRSMPFPNAQCFSGLDLELGVGDVVAAVGADLVEGIRGQPAAPPSPHPLTDCLSQIPVVGLPLSSSRSIRLIYFFLFSQV